MTFYVDRAATVVHGAVRRVRLLYDYRSALVDPDTLAATRSMTTSTDVDCSDGTLTGLEGTGYDGGMASGKVVSRLRASPEGERHGEAVKPGSLDAKVVAFVCSMPERRAGR